MCGVNVCSMVRSLLACFVLGLAFLRLVCLSLVVKHCCVLEVVAVHVSHNAMKSSKNPDSMVTTATMLRLLCGLALGRGMDAFRSGVQAIDSSHAYLPVQAIQGIVEPVLERRRRRHGNACHPQQTCRDVHA